MKKKIQYMAMALLLAALAGCGKSQAVVEPKEMVLKPVMAASAMGDLSEEPDTKADPELTGTTLGTDNSYVVYLSASHPQQPAFMEGQLYSYIAASSKWEASSDIGTADPLYWPMGQEQTDFLAYACTPAAQAALAPDWDGSIPANGFTISDWDTYAKQYDVMYAVANGQTAGNTGIVNLSFNHTMAIIGFTAVSTAADIITINRITINGLGYSGTLTVDNSRTELSATWGALATADKAVFKLDDPVSTNLAFNVPTSATQCAAHLLVPQQLAKSVTLNYHLAGADTDLDYLIKLPRTTWKTGYKYIYALGFTPSEIVISETVTDWSGSAEQVPIE